MMEGNPTLLSRGAPDDVCAVLVLNRPDALNALNGPLLDALDAALDDIESDDRRRALILAGAGRAFSAGADLKEYDIDPIERVDRMHRLVLRLRDFPKISVAAIDGLALGGGLELAMACTFRIAGHGAKFGLPEIRMNLMPGYGGTQLLPRLVGVSNALEMMLSGEPIDAARALSLGLVNDLSEDPIRAAEALAKRCSRYGLSAQQAIRAAVHNGATLPIDRALKLERELVDRVAKSDDAHRGVQGFRERRRR